MGGKSIFSKGKSTDVDLSASMAHSAVVNKVVQMEHRLQIGKC